MPQHLESSDSKEELLNFGLWLSIKKAAICMFKGMKEKTSERGLDKFLDTQDCSLH